MHVVARFNESPGAFYPLFSLNVLAAEALFSRLQTANLMREFIFMRTDPNCSPAW